jgi:hypothetical protein
MAFSTGEMPSGTRVFARSVKNGTTAYPTISPRANLTIGTSYYDFYIEIGTSFGGTAFTIYPQLEYGTEPTDFVPYTGNTISVTFPSEAGTVYGGTLTINPDKTGELVVDMARTLLDGVNYTLGGRTQYTNVSRYWLNKSIGRFKYKGQNTYFLSSKLTPSYNNVIAIGNNTPSGYYIFPYSSGDTFVVLPNSITSNAEATAWLQDNPTEVCFELAEPVTIPLTESEISGILTTLYGTNNIWADTGDVEVEYPADTKLYIDNKITQAIANALNS